VTAASLMWECFSLTPFFIYFSLTHSSD